MMRRLQALLTGDADAARDAGGEDDVRVAAAALLVEAACMDGKVDSQERRVIAAVLAAHFGLGAEEAAALLAAAEKAVEGTEQIYAFTRVIKDSFSEDERVRMIEMLWEVAYADGTLHDYEANLVRRICGLIYVPDRLSGAARKRVLTRRAGG